MQAPLAGLSEERLWMLPLLATHAAHAPCRIAWFMGTVLPAIRECEAAAAAAHAAGRERNARVLVGRASQLWRLLPVVLRAPTDVVAGAFDANLGRILSSLLANAARPDLAELAGRGLAALIAGLRAAAGLPPVGLERLTGGAGQDDGDDEAGDGGRSVAGEGGGGATVLGAGGVSVYGGSVSPSDPRHHWLAQAIKAPPLSDGKQPRGVDGDDAGAAAAAARVASATAGLAAVASLARNYLPVLFNAYEVRTGGRGGGGTRRPCQRDPPPASRVQTAAVAASLPIVQPAAGSGASAVPLPPVTGAALLSRVRHVLEATAQYLSIAPQEFSRSLGARLVAMLAAGLAALAEAQVRSRRQGRRLRATRSRY